MLTIITEDMLEDDEAIGEVVRNHINDSIWRMIEGDLLRGIDERPVPYVAETKPAEPVCCFLTEINGYKIEILRKQNEKNWEAEDVQLKIDEGEGWLSDLTKQELMELVQKMTETIADLDAQYDNHMYSCCE